MRDRMPADPDDEARITAGLLRLVGLLGYALTLAVAAVILGAGAALAVLVYRAIAG